jgi:hypothetical protein
VLNPNLEWILFGIPTEFGSFSVKILHRKKTWESSAGAGSNRRTGTAGTVGINGTGLKSLPFVFAFIPDEETLFTYLGSARA